MDDNNKNETDHKYLTTLYIDLYRFINNNRRQLTTKSMPFVEKNDSETIYNKTKVHQF